MMPESGLAFGNETHSWPSPSGSAWSRSKIEMLKPASLTNELSVELSKLRRNSVSRHVIASSSCGVSMLICGKLPKKPVAAFLYAWYCVRLVMSTSILLAWPEPVITDTLVMRKPLGRLWLWLPRLEYSWLAPTKLRRL